LQAVIDHDCSGAKAALDGNELCCGGERKGIGSAAHRN
jgi:hypothetical protein